MIDRWRAVLGLAVTLAGALWISIGFPSLAWFGSTPIGLYRSLDQPPILLTLVGLWYTARGIRRISDEPVVQPDSSTERSEAAAGRQGRKRSPEPEALKRREP